MFDVQRYVLKQSTICHCGLFLFISLLYQQLFPISTSIPSASKSDLWCIRCWSLLSKKSCCCCWNWRLLQQHDCRNYHYNKTSQEEGGMDAVCQSFYNNAAWVRTYKWRRKESSQRPQIYPSYLIVPNQYWIFGAYSEGLMISTIKESWTELQSWLVKRESVVNHKISQQKRNVFIWGEHSQGSLALWNTRVSLHKYVEATAREPALLAIQLCYLWQNTEWCSFQTTSVRQAVTNSVNVMWLETWGYVQRPLVEKHTFKW